MNSPLAPLAMAADASSWQSHTALGVVGVTILIFAIGIWRRSRSPKGSSSCGGGQCGCSTESKVGKRPS